MSLDTIVVPDTEDVDGLAAQSGVFAAEPDQGAGETVVIAHVLARTFEASPPNHQVGAMGMAGPVLIFEGFPAHQIIGTLGAVISDPVATRERSRFVHVRQILSLSPSGSR